MNNSNLENAIFNIQNAKDFEVLALEIFRFQYLNNSVYSEFCNYLGITDPKDIKEIPFLPISFFKSRKIIAYNYPAELVFKSSGTTGQSRSQHFISKPELYKKSFITAFELLMGDIKGSVFMALLPNYIEQGDSSLVYMVDHLIKKSGNKLSGFYLNNHDNLLKSIGSARKESKSIFLFGVSYALLDLAEKNTDLSGVKVIETGGMKGRRKELTREELHENLKAGLNIDTVYSEYGMTELLSQAYLQKDGFFHSPRWMKILIRDVNDALTFLPEGKTGGVNVIDLANLYSCSFIATDDLGVKSMEFFKILGRFDLSDIRGCNLLVN